MKPIDIQLRLHPKERFLPTDRNFQLSDTHPVYYKIGSYAYNGRRYTSVIYEIYYAANGAIGLNSADIYNASLGYHTNDIERIIILHDPTTEEPIHVFFSAHAQEGLWYKYSDCEIADNKLIVYASLNSHSTHPKPKTNIRVLGFANDYSSKGGKYLDLIATQDDSISYRAQNDEVINSWWKRLMLPFYQSKIPALKAKQAETEARVNLGI